MVDYAWICLNKQDSEYASGPKYAKILNIAKLWIWHGSQYTSCRQRSEYIRICLDRVLNISRVLNMQELHRILIVPQYGWICLNRTSICLKYVWIVDNRLVSEYVSYNTQREATLHSTYWEMGVFRTLSNIKDRALWKNNYISKLFLQNTPS